MSGESPGTSDEVPLSNNELYMTYLSKLLPPLLAITSITAANAVEKINIPPPARIFQRPLVYSVEFTNPPSLIPRTTRGEESALKRLLKSNSILIGSHLSTRTNFQSSDNNLQIDLINRMLKYLPKNINENKSKSFAIGILLPATKSIQTALDSYVTLKDVEEGEADKILFDIISKELSPSSLFSHPLNKELLHLARNRGIPLLAVDLPDNITQQVYENGLSSIDENIRQALVPDLEGFVQNVIGDGFRRYADNVLVPMVPQSSASTTSTTTSAIATEIKNLQPSTENYISVRMLRDEVIGARTAEWIDSHSSNDQKDDKSPTVLLLLGEEQTKFGYGVQERLIRNIRRLRSLRNVTVTPDKEKEVLSVLLNPTAQDSLSFTAQLRLTLAYGPFLKEQRPLANYLWFSQPPILKILARTKNAINAEGDKPPGESSILKAF